MLCEYCKRRNNITNSSNFYYSHYGVLKKIHAVSHIQQNKKNRKIKILRKTVYFR